MDTPTIQNSLPACYVPVRRLSSSELARIYLNPFYVVFKCGRCRRRVKNGPKCSKCRISFHYGCAIQHKSCCGVDIIPVDTAPKFCPRCDDIVEFGPECDVCKSRFHSFCIGPLEQCCQLNILERKVLGQCDKCADIVLFGPRCPFCGKVYHEKCVGQELECCGLRYESDDNIAFKCKRCNRRIGLGCLICLSCGGLRHNYCFKRNKLCCGKEMSHEFYLIPSFKFTINYYNQFGRRRATLKKLQEMVVDHAHQLRNSDRKSFDKPNDDAVSNSSNDLDSIIIENVKSDADEVISIKSEIEIEESPVLFEIEVNTPEPSPSSAFESDDSLKNLFDLLYNMVKRFPPQLQTEVKIDLFKTVTEADLKFKSRSK